MKTKALLSIALIFCATIFMVSCSNKKSDKNKKAESQTETMSNEELAGKIIEIYEEGCVELGKILDKYPEANQAMKEEYEKLYEATIQKMVPYGKIINEKKPADVEKISSMLFSKMVDLKSVQATLDKYNSRSSEISKFDSELSSKMSGMNIITQYAFFDLLKKQNPEEAKRLGIE